MRFVILTHSIYYSFPKQKRGCNQSLPPAKKAMTVITWLNVSVFRVFEDKFRILSSLLPSSFTIIISCFPRYCKIKMIVLGKTARLVYICFILFFFLVKTVPDSKCLSLKPSKQVQFGRHLFAL